MTYALFQADNTTEVQIPQPDYAEWRQVSRGAFADGTERTAARVAVTWRYKRPISEADYQLFLTYRPAGGKMQFRTWRAATGGSPATFVKCEGVMSAIVAGVLSAGEYAGVQVTFTAVTEVV